MAYPQPPEHLSVYESDFGCSARRTRWARSATDVPSFSSPSPSPTTCHTPPPAKIAGNATRFSS